MGDLTARKPRARLAAALLALTGLAVLLSPANRAAATTFCVPNLAACPAGVTGTAQANLESAMQSNGADGQADLIYVAPGTYTDPDTFSPSNIDQLTIQGSGTANTVLTSSNAGGVYIVNLNSALRSTTMRDLTIQVPSSFTDGGGSGIQAGAGTVLQNVDIRTFNPGSSGAPSWPKGGAYLGGRVYASGAGSFNQGIAQSTIGTGTLAISGVEVRGSDVPISLAAPASTVLLDRLLLSEGTQSAVQISGGTATIRNSIVRTTGQPAVSVFINSANSANVNVDHLTAINSGGPQPAVQSEVGGANTGNASLTVSDSIIRTHALAYRRSAPVSPSQGNASLAIRFSNLPNAATTPGSEVNTGDGSLTVQGNIDANPLFTSTSDFSLTPASPSIDAGDPTSSVATDALGAPRPNDGNGDGTAVTDQGAFEYQRPVPPGPPTPVDTTPPRTKKVSGPKAKITARKAKFRFSSSEAPSRFQCKLDKKPYAGCRSPRTYKKLKLGKHVLLVRAIDVAGNLDRTPVKFKFRVIRPRG